MAFLLYLVVYCLKSCHIHCVTHACWCISIGSADELVRRNVYCFTLLSSLLWSSDGQWHRGESVYISHGQQHSLLWNGALIKLEAKIWEKKKRGEGLHKGGDPSTQRKHVMCKLTLRPPSLHVPSVLSRWPAFPDVFYYIYSKSYTSMSLKCLELHFCSYLWFMENQPETCLIKCPSRASKGRYIPLFCTSIHFTLNIFSI